VDVAADLDDDGVRESPVVAIILNDEGGPDFASRPVGEGEVNQDDRRLG